MVAIQISILPAAPGPFDGRNFKGRLALSHDGNFNDEDDWGAVPMGIALIDALGIQESLVHCHYNNILKANDPDFEREQRISTLGAADRYNLSPEIFFDCQRELDEAIAHLRTAVNQSSQGDPLYIIVAGPMEVPWRAIHQSERDKRQYVYCVSHNPGNDGLSVATNAWNAGRNKRDLIDLGINWIQVTEGNRLLSSGGKHTSYYDASKRPTAAQWARWHWLRDAKDARLNWIWDRLQVEQRGDVSDCTIYYSLFTGDYLGDIPKFRNLLDRGARPQINNPKRITRLEAENFSTLNNFKGRKETKYAKRKALSQESKVYMDRIDGGSIRTVFREIYTPLRGLYNITIRHYDGSRGAASFRLKINGEIQGHFTANQGGDTWRSETIEAVTVSEGDAIEVECQGDDGEFAELDFVELELIQGLK